MPLLLLALQAIAVIGVWAIFGVAALPSVPLALAYVLAFWVVAEGITLGIFVAQSLAPLSTLIPASLRDSASVMWAVPGLLLIASGSPFAMAVGVAAIIYGTHLLVSNRAPNGGARPVNRRRHHREAHVLFRTERPQFFSSERLLTITAALLLQVGIYALASRYSLLAGASFAAVTAICSAMAVSSGALAAKSSRRGVYPALNILATLLLTVTLTAVLVRIEAGQVEVGQDPPSATGDATGARNPPNPPGITGRLFRRITEATPSIGLNQPAPGDSARAEPGKINVTKVVDPAPAAYPRFNGGIPGVVLRPKDSHIQVPQITMERLRVRFSGIDALAIPFTGQYELFRASSGRLPAGAPVEIGTPLERVYGTTNGGAMETVAVQMFNPPIDLSLCGKILVGLTMGEQTMLLASMQLIGDEGVEEAGTDLVGMKAKGDAEFEIPHSKRVLLVRAIRISFLHAMQDRNKNVRIAVERFTLVPRGVSSDMR